MPTEAPDTKTIRNFKGNFRAAIASIIDGAGWTSATLERSMTKLKATGRREISFNLGAPLNQETLMSGRKVYDYFGAKFRIRIVTSRRQEQSSPAAEAIDLHERMVAAVLDLFSEENNPFTEANLPYYAVTKLMPAGTESDLDVVYFEDFTDINFEVEFGIRSTAWPSGY